MASDVVERIKGSLTENLNLKLLSFAFALVLYSLVHDAQDAQRVIDALGIHADTIPITDAVDGYLEHAPDADPRRHAVAAAGSGTVTAPMPGKIVSVNVAPGDVVETRALLVVLEAMKMEHRIEAPLAGTIERVYVQLGDLVTADATLVTIGA